MRELTVVHVHIDAIVADGPVSVDRDTLRDVNTRRRMAVPLRKAKVDNVDLVPATANAHKEVVGLDIAVDEVPRVNVLHAGNLREQRQGQ